MTAWEQRKLGEIFEEYSEKNRADLPPLTIIQGGGTVYRDESNRNLQFDKNSLSNYKAVNPDDFIVHLRSFEGGLEKATYCGLISPAYHTFHSDGIDSDFYYLYFRSKRFIDTDLKPHVYGIRDGRSIDIDGMKTIPIPWTTVNEQRAIGGFYNSLDSFITLHQRKCQYRSLYGYLSWEQRKLGNCGTTYGGLSGKTKEDFGHGNARFVPYTNVFDNPLTDTKRLETVEIDSSQNKVAYGDTFFTVSSEMPDEVGMSSVWLSDQDDVYLNSFCFGYRQDSTFDPHYLAYMLRSSSIRSDLTLLAQGISRFNISKNKVMELSVPVPSAAEQKQIGQYFARLDSLITLHQ